LKFKEGFNASILVNELGNVIEIGGVLGAGAGETCEDIIIDENGFQAGNDCVSCDGFIKSINGVPTPDGRLRINGTAGVSVVPEPENNRIRTTIEPNQFCESE
jgi:hypothetical protein